jgi:glycosyltransferase involved in cell wall biosynthesis
MISVCIATFNGEKYIEKQLASILSQIAENDEVVICDDGSNDRTISLIENFTDIRIRLHNNPIRLGHVKNFEAALSLARGDYIFLSDQDDVWLSGRVERMLSFVEGESRAWLVASNFDLIDENGVLTGEFRGLGSVKSSKTSQLFSILAGSAPYYGCTFLLKKEALKYCLPIPNNIESHDIWIAMVVSCLGRVVNIWQPTLQHRIHGTNMTVKNRRRLWIILRSRFSFLVSLVVRLFAIKSGRFNFLLL